MQQWTGLIRRAGPADAPALADLSTQLGYPSTEAQVRERLPAVYGPAARLDLEPLSPAGVRSLVFLPVGAAGSQRRTP